MNFFLVLFSLAAMSMAEDVQYELIPMHNVARAKHSAGPLYGDDELVQNATKCAQLSAARGYIAHDCPHQPGNGENLAMSTGVISATTAFNLWYDESEKYDYTNPGFSSATGHFTQVVWKGTEKMGCGFADDIITVICCLYYRPGNYMGQFEQNVYKPEAQ